MQDAKTGGSRWVPDIREDEITEFQEQNGDETATYKAVNVHPIISRVLDKLAFFRTHVSAVWYNKLANKTVKDKLDEIDTSISSLNSRTPYGYRVTVELQANVTKNVTCELPEGIDKSYLPIIVYANNSTWQDPYTAEITHQYISGSTGLLDFGVKSDRAGTYTFSVTFLKRDGELSPIS